MPIVDAGWEGSELSVDVDKAVENVRKPCKSNDDKCFVDNLCCFWTHSSILLTSVTFDLML